MGRHPYSPEELDQIFACFIRVTNKIMEEKGPGAVTIRKVAELAGYKSATLYYYFTDLEHLIMYASMKYLQEYNKKLASSIGIMKDPYLRFCSIWELFCDSAFKKPEAFYRLFYGKYRNDLEEIIKVYYRVFPDELTGVDDSVLDMLRRGSIVERNMSILKPLAQAGYLSAEKLPIYNEIILHCFQVLLEEKISQGDGLDNDALIRRHQLYIKTLLGDPIPAP